MSFLQLVLLLDKTIEGINSILPIVSYRNKFHTLLSVKCSLNSGLTSATFKIFYSKPEWFLRCVLLVENMFILFCNETTVKVVTLLFSVLAKEGNSRGWVNSRYSISLNLT